MRKPGFLPRLTYGSATRIFLLAALVAAPFLFLIGYGSYQLWLSGWGFYVWWPMAACMAAAPST